MKRFWLASIALLTGCLGAQTLDIPAVGFIYSPSGQTVELRGLAGAFLPRIIDSERVESLAFSGAWGLRKSASRVSIFDQSGQVVESFEAPSGGAVFGFDEEGRPSLAWFPESRVLFAWSRGGGRGPSKISPHIPPDWQVRALASAGRADARMLVDDGSALYSALVSRRDGAITSLAPLGARSGPAWLAADGSMAYCAPETSELVLLEPGGRERRFLLETGPSAIYQAGRDWLAVLQADGAVRGIRLRHESLDYVSLPALEASR